MKFLKVVLALFFIGVLGTGFSQNTEIVYLSGTDAANTVKWDFYCTDGQNSGKWTTIDVPSNWELQGFGIYNYGHDWKDKSKKLGKEHGLYKHTFEVPKSWKGKIVNIVFDGAMTDTKVKINGKQAGEIHQGAFYRFKYDISKLLKYGKSNLLEVDVAKHSANTSVNAAERQADFWIFGGIFRPVFLEILPPVHINRAAIDAKANGTFNALIVLNKSNTEYSLTIDLFDLEGNKKGEPVTFQIKKGETEIPVSGKIENILAWNPEWPTLYDMQITLKNGDEILHKITRRIGFRTVELRRHDGFYINNEKVVFKGVCRHSFRPETGRCLSDKNQREDIRLIKEMNMNAVRMSHYLPDARFLDLCDSLGLFVLDEITGWQDGYDTIVGPKLIKEAVLKDENHPSVVIWDHGNEGGWNFANEKWLHHYDIQKRPVICPWLLHNGVDTHHYPEYGFGAGRFVYGNDPFMPTELLHGLYDGGHGAGLEDYWRNYETSPLLAGGFLWDFADEAVLRTDKKGTHYDADENHAPDGILGPHLEKEGSFYTVKEIWSPVQIEPVTINKKWNGKLFLKNKFIYTNLNRCSFNWKLVKTSVSGNSEIVATGNPESPDAEPGTTVAIKIDCGNALQTADLFLFTATNQHGKELYTWSWPVKQPAGIAAEIIKNLPSEKSEIRVKENNNLITCTTNNIEITFSTKNGTIQNIKNSTGKISFSGGPVPAGVNSKVTATEWKIDNNGDFIFDIYYDNYPKHIHWEMQKDGLLKLEAAPLQTKLKDIDFIGISFNYPEEKCKSVKWMGRGPYRVWKNRIKGSNIGVWEKEYNNTVTGESFNHLIYPEFKGYHGNIYWAEIGTTESPFLIISETPNLFMQLYKPATQKFPRKGTTVAFPEGDISFLYEIPAIGTKFKTADKLGPQSQKGISSYHNNDENYPLKLWFDFRGK